MDKHQRNNNSPNTHEKRSIENQNETLLSDITNENTFLKIEKTSINFKLRDFINSNKPAILANPYITNYLLHCVSSLKVSEKKNEKPSAHSKLFPLKSMDLSHADRLQSNSSNNSMNYIRDSHSIIDQDKSARSNTILYQPSLLSLPPNCTSNPDSPSPCASIGSFSHELKSPPLYENVDFYKSSRTLTQTSTYYHQQPKPGSHSRAGSQDSRHSYPGTSKGTCEGSSAQYQSNYGKAQLQNSVSYPKYIPPMRKEVPPYESPPAYKILLDTNKSSNSYETAKPGSQVSIQSIDHISQYPSQHATPNIKSIPTVVQNAIKALEDYSSQTKPHNMRAYSSANNLINSQGSSKPTAISSQMCVVRQPALAEFRSKKQSHSMTKMYQTASAYQRESPTHYSVPTRASPPPPLPIKTKQLAKNLLPYNITPPRPMGPTEAEKKIEELTRQLEEQMETQETEVSGEYFGICYTCGNKVIGNSQACQAMDNLYHTKCFICCACGRELRGKAFYNVYGRVYCEEDYMYIGFQQTAEKCSICGHLIMETILQAMGKSFHPGCFRCCICNLTLDGISFTVDIDNKIYCITDYYRKYAPKCAVCGKGITPIEGTGETIRVVSMDKNYHVDCFVCEGCGVQLTNEPDRRYYPLDSHLLCKSCHITHLHDNQPELEIVSAIYEYLD